jgi:hypothetical protein
MTTLTPTAERLAAHMMAAIKVDIGVGSVPVDVPDFSALHDTVDANTYVLDAAQALGIEWGETGMPTEDAYALFNAAESLVDEALKTALTERVLLP